MIINSFCIIPQGYGHGITKLTKVINIGNHNVAMSCLYVYHIVALRIHACTYMYVTFFGQPCLRHRTISFLVSKLGITV